jgi:nucleoside-diphosphate-sugar epimerase
MADLLAQLEQPSAAPLGWRDQALFPEFVGPCRCPDPQYFMRPSGSRSVIVWGTGTPRREFLYVDDMADACVHLMKTYSSAELINIGTGEDITIAEFARVVAGVVDYRGEITFEHLPPDDRAIYS